MAFVLCPGTRGKKSRSELSGDNFYRFPVNPLRLNSKLQDVDDSKWETSKDGTVVKKQPGDAQKITRFNVAEKSKFQVRFSSLLFKEQVREVERGVEDPILRESPTTPGRMRWRRTCKR